MNTRLIGYIGAIVIVALGTGVISGTVFPTFDIPEQYLVAVMSGGGAFLLTLLFIFTIDEFDDDRYFSTGLTRPSVDSVFVAGLAMLVAGGVVFAFDWFGIGAVTKTIADTVSVSGRIILAAGLGVSAGLGLFYHRTRRFFTKCVTS